MDEELDDAAHDAVGVQADQVGTVGAFGFADNESIARVNATIRKLYRVRQVRFSMILPSIWMMV